MIGGGSLVGGGVVLGRGDGELWGGLVGGVGGGWVAGSGEGDLELLLPVLGVLRGHHVVIAAVVGVSSSNS